MPRMRLSALVFLTLLVPGYASAQACFGSPVRSGIWTLGLDADFTTGTQGFGLDIGGTTSSHLIGDVAGRYDHFSAGHALGADGTIGVEVPLSKLSLCPATGLSYSHASAQTAYYGTVIANEIVIPVVLAVGTTMSLANAVSITVFATPQYMYMRTKYPSYGTAYTFNEFGSALGATLGFSRLFLSGSVFISSIQNSDPTFGVSVGIPLGK